jgi:hypothetical protein
MHFSYNYETLNQKSEQFTQNKSENNSMTSSSFFLYGTQHSGLKAFLNLFFTFSKILLNMLTMCVIPYFYYPLIILILALIFVNYGYFITIDEEFIIAICFFIVITTLYNIAAIQLYKMSDAHRRAIWAYLLFTLNRLEFVLLGFVQTNVILLLQKIASLEEFLLLSRNFLFLCLNSIDYFIVIFINYGHIIICTI